MNRSEATGNNGSGKGSPMTIIDSEFSSAHAAVSPPEPGAMNMPAAFPYREVFFRGKPRHDRDDAFRIRHPQMDPGRRAKIFAPFDALKGFDEAIAETERNS